MTQQYGLICQRKPQMRDIPGRPNYTCLRSGFCKNNNKNFESVADKNTPSSQWKRKRSYILKLKKENNKKYSKSPSKPKFKYNKLKKITNAQAYEEKENNRKLGCYKRGKFLLSKKNNYNNWTNVEKPNEEYPHQSSSNTTERSKISLDKSTLNNWKKVRNTHIVKKFDRFAKEMLTLTGELSEETIDLITENIKENLQKKEEKFKRTNSKTFCKRNTVSFIKNILQGKSGTISSNSGKRTQKKNKLVRQSRAPYVRTTSGMPPKFFYMKSSKTAAKTAVKTKNIQRNTKSLYRSQSELLVKSTHALKIRTQSYSPTSYTILFNPFEYSSVNADTNLCAQTDPSIMDLRQESSTKAISIFKQECVTDCSEPEVIENIGSSPSLSCT